MALTKKHLNDVCYLQGGHLQCRYLDEDFDDNGQIVSICKKLSPERKIIDQELRDFLNDAKKTGQDPIQQGVPLGDNCQGFVVLKSKPQGYDVKN